jgi:Regulator of chromosome condensation (RCC1) repeat
MRSLRVRTVLARLAGGIALMAAMAGVTAGASVPAQARVTGIVFQSHVMASWGSAWLGDGTPGRSLYGDIKAVGNNVAQVSAGLGFHRPVARSDGTVWAWGQNNHGQFGNFSTDFSDLPVMVAGLSHATGISAGGEHAVATATSGISVLTSVWAWGDNDDGQLGSTPSIARSRPANTVGIGSGITQLSAGGAYVLALKSNGIVLAWGSNSSGQLGIGNTTSPVGPVQVAGLTSATQVAAGMETSFAIHTVPYLVGL